MNRRVNPLIIIMLLLASLQASHAHAQQADPGVAAAQSLLEQAAEPQSDGSHNTMLLGLRQLEDPGLKPLFTGLSNSPYLSMRIHGRLGAAALSPKQRIDLALLAEVEDQRELVQVVSAAIDDGLIDNMGLATLLTWDGLDLPIRQGIALRVMGVGGEVDTKPFLESLEVELNDDLAASKLLQYALAGMMLAESGDPAGRKALMELAKLEGDNAIAVTAQVLDAAMRQGFGSVGQLALLTATDTTHAPSLRLLAIQSAMRLGTPGAQRTWRSMFENETVSAQRIRLAMIALDSAEEVEPALFDTLSNQGEWITAIARAGRAIATDEQGLAKAMQPMIALGQPLSVQWVTTYCRRAEPTQGPALLELIIRLYRNAPKHHRGKMSQAAIDATTVLCELYPGQANERLAALLDINQARPAGIGDDAIDLERRQIMLLGIARAQSNDLAPLAQLIEPDTLNDFTTEALRLFIRAKHDAPLTDKEWEQVSEIVQGVGQMDNAMRLQLAWAYLKHKGLAEQSIAKVFR
ncbi:MAG: hypothetical protein AAGB26_02295 [Planctomycetota bacterium]